MAKKNETSSRLFRTNKTIKKSNDQQKIKNTGEEKKEDETNDNSLLLFKKIKNPIWVSVSEAAKLGGVQTKTIRRAIKSNRIGYKIISNRYLINFSSLIFFLHTKTKLKNKLKEYGLGQYVREWEK